MEFYFGYKIGAEIVEQITHFLLALLVASDYSMDVSLMDTREVRSIMRL